MEKPPDLSLLDLGGTRRQRLLNMTTRERIQEWLTDLDPEISVILADGFEAAFLGMATQFSKEPVAVYDRRKCIAILAEQFAEAAENDLDSAWDMAEEYFSFNVEGAWVGEQTPMFLDRFGKSP
jgi:hypothetical protein